MEKHMLSTLGIAMTCIVLLSGCSSQQGGESATPNASTQSMINAREQAARRFVSCLTDQGITARTEDSSDTYVIAGKQYSPKDLVSVRMLDATGAPANGDNDSVTSALYPDVDSISSDDNGQAWVAFKDSSQMEGTPYASKQQAYADCEAKNPDFEQPLTGTFGHQEWPEESIRASLEFAKSCRAKGFDWLPDPPKDTPGITIPDGVSDEQFLRFLKECPADDLPIESQMMTYKNPHYGDLINQHQSQQ